jgi:D-tyrosyl-tRNA(Tyr) deacylase
MRVLLQRVTQASVEVAGATVGKVDQGFLALVGITGTDDRKIVEKMAQKVFGLRVFTDQEDKFNWSLADVDGGVLVVSQFTLYADAKKGRRPSFSKAGRPDVAAPLVEYFAECLTELGCARVEQGEFGAAMKVQLCNDGPVTIWLDSDEIF